MQHMNHFSSSNHKYAKRQVTFTLDFKEASIDGVSLFKLQEYKFAEFTPTDLLLLSRSVALAQRSLGFSCIYCIISIWTYYSLFNCGFEPMTQGFSVLCSNQERLKQIQHIYDDVENTAAYGRIFPSLN